MELRADASSVLPSPSFAGRLLRPRVPALVRSRGGERVPARGSVEERSWRTRVVTLLALVCLSALGLCQIDD